jgi:hypothetical protein
LHIIKFPAETNPATGAEISTQLRFSPFLSFTDVKFGTSVTLPLAATPPFTTAVFEGSARIDKPFGATRGSTWRHRLTGPGAGAGAVVGAGVGAGEGAVVGAGVGAGEGAVVGAGAGVAVGVAVGVGAGEGAVVGAGFGVGAGAGEGLGVTALPVVHETKLPSLLGYPIAT